MSQSRCIDPYGRFRLYWAHNQGGDNHNEQQFSLGKDPATKSDDFLEKIHQLMTFKLIKTYDEEIGSQVTMVLVRDP